MCQFVTSLLRSAAGRFCAVCLVSCGGLGLAIPSNLGLQPGSAEGVEISSSPAEWKFNLRNTVLEAQITCDAGVLQPIRLTNKMSGRELPPPSEAFMARFFPDKDTGQSDTALSSGDFQVLGMNLSRIEAQVNASQMSLTMPGWTVTATLKLSRGAAEWTAVWSAELRDGSNYLKLALRLSRFGEAGQDSKASLKLVGDEVAASEEGNDGNLESDTELCLLAGNLQSSTSAGKVDGVPIISDHFFFGLEHPQALNSAKGGQYRCCLKQHAEKIAEHGAHATLVLGVTFHGQGRRSFFHYLERERAHPSRKMLHYNSWYDIGTGQQFNAKQARDRLDHIARELSRRGAVLDSFLLDARKHVEHASAFI